jgi:hypothetical protein
MRLRAALVALVMIGVVLLGAPGDGTARAQSPSPTPRAATVVVTPAVAPPSTGSGGFLDQASDATSSGYAMTVLAIATVIAVGGAAIATRKR